MKKSELEGFKAYFEEFDKKLHADRQVEGSLLAAIGLLLVAGLEKTSGFVEADDNKPSDETTRA